MKALTLHQPWASLIMLSEKTWETRSWATRYRGRLAIHASKRLPAGLDALFEEVPFFEQVLGSYKHPLAGRGVTVNDLPLGVVLGTVRLYDVCRVEDVPAKTINDELFGDWSPGRFAWQLGAVEVFPEPIAARGALGVWEWDGEAA